MVAPVAVVLDNRREMIKVSISAVASMTQALVPAVAGQGRNDVVASPGEGAREG